jgi:hypothetical protein
VYGVVRRCGVACCGFDFWREILEEELFQVDRFHRQNSRVTCQCKQHSRDLLVLILVSDDKAIGDVRCDEGCLFMEHCWVKAACTEYS